MTLKGNGQKTSSEVKQQPTSQIPPGSALEGAILRVLLRYRVPEITTKLSRNMLIMATRSLY